MAIANAAVSMPAMATAMPLKPGTVRIYPDSPATHSDKMPKRHRPNISVVALARSAHCGKWRGNGAKPTVTGKSGATETTEPSTQRQRLSATLPESQPVRYCADAQNANQRASSHHGRQRDSCRQRYR